MKRAAPLLALLGLAFAAYSNSLHSEFIGDDLSRIVQSATHFQAGLSSTLAEVLPDRPLLMLSIWLNYLAGVTSPLGYKIANVVFHGLTAWALFELLVLLFSLHGSLKSPRWTAFACAALFVVHPAGSQAINIVIQRGAVLAALFTLLSFQYFVRSIRLRQPGAHGWSIFFFLLALLSKPNAMAAPLLFAAYGLYFDSGGPLGRSRIFRSLLPHFFLLVIPLVFYFVMGENVQRPALSWHQYFRVQARVVFVYFRLFFAPLDLHYYYEISQDPGLARNLTWLAFLGHGAIVASAWALRNRARLVSFFVFATYILLIPESSFFPIQHVMFEHRTYLPFLFLTPALVTFVAGIPGLATPAAVAAVAVAGLFTGLTRARNAETDTYRKWSENTDSHYVNDHMYNTRLLLGMLQQSDREAFRSKAASLKNRFPAILEYELLLAMVEFPTDNSPQARHQFERIASKLEEPDRFPVFIHARMALISFLAARAEGLFGKTQGMLRVDALFYPMMPVLSKRWDSTYDEALGFYQQLLHRLDKELARRPDSASVFRRVRALATLEVYFGETAPGEPLENRIRKLPPGQAGPLLDWYKSKRKP